MADPDVTCVIPTFNGRRSVAKAVGSVLQQSGPSVEVLLVDDCSDGPNREHLEEVAATDSRIRLFALSRNGGQAQARNVGAALARGRFLTFLDQDDEHVPSWYQRGVQYLQADPRLSAISGRARIVDLPERLGIDESDLRVRGLSLVFVTNMIFRTSVFRASGGFPTTKIWRTPVAGEDGIYRTNFARNWHAGQVDDAALIHHAREGGATVYFLDRSEVREGKVVITRFHDIECNGELAEASRLFTDRLRSIADELRACSGPSSACAPQARASGG